MSMKDSPIQIRPGIHPKGVYFTLVQGIEAFNRTDYYEAHDYWEEVWHQITGEAREFIQGLIHIAVGLFHWSNGNATGSLSQLKKGILKLERYQPLYLGFQIEKLVQAVTPFVQTLDRVVQDEVKREQFHPMQYSARYPRLEWDVETVRVAFGLGSGRKEDVMR